MPGSYQAVYNGSKAFLDSFAVALNAELKDAGVTVTCLMPGATETDFFERAEMLDTKVAPRRKRTRPMSPQYPACTGDSRGTAISGRLGRAQHARFHPVRTVDRPDPSRSTAPMRSAPLPPGNPRGQRRTRGLAERTFSYAVAEALRHVGGRLDFAEHHCRVMLGTQIARHAARVPPAPQTGHPLDWGETRL
jgi:hypothetical protein